MAGPPLNPALFHNRWFFEDIKFKKEVNPRALVTCSFSNGNESVERMKLCLVVYHLLYIRRCRSYFTCDVFGDMYYILFENYCHIKTEGCVFGVCVYVCLL